MSRKGFILTPEAQGDLLDLWNYIADDSIDNADHVLERLYHAFGKLVQTPGLGHVREDLADSRHRFWNVYSYTIAYRWETAPLQIVAVVHGARDLEAFFQRRTGNEWRDD
jgi:plasmid stabilization system protein ParE